MGLAGLLLMSGIAWGQAASPPTTMLRVTTKLVVLDVVVTDKAGAPVRGLSREDFTVFEDGKEQRLRSFDSTDAGVPGASSKPKMIFVLDELNDTFAEMADSRSGLKKYLQTQKDGMATPTMLIAVSSNGLKVLHGYTTDAQELIPVLDHHTPGVPYKAAAGFAVERLAQTLSMLQQVAISMRGEEGRKSIIWVGKGFPSVDPAKLIDRDRTVVAKALRTTVNLLLKSRMTVNKVDPTGLSSGVTAMDPDRMFMTSDDGADPYDGAVSFNSLTLQTGGRYYYNRNDLDREIGQSVEQGRVFYTLSFTPTSVEADGVYRHLRVSVRQPAALVQTKHGYYGGTELPPEPSQAELALDLGQAASNSLTYSGVVVHVLSLVPNPHTGAQAGTALATLSVDGSTLTYATDEHGDGHAHVYFAVANFGEKNKMIGFNAQRVDTTVKAANLERVTTSQPLFHVTVPLAAGTKRLRVVVRDVASGKTGSSDVDPAKVPSVVAGP